MYMTLAQTLVLHWMCCELCVAISVPVVWNDTSDSSEVNNSKTQKDFSVDTIQSHDVKSALQYETASSKPIPQDYFQYTAKKPQFAIDIAAYHGVKSPENHYRAYPIRPYTGKEKPDFGKHHIYDKRNIMYYPLQKSLAGKSTQSEVTPVSSSYEVYHPYKAEQPGLEEIYKDPVLEKIRNDIKNNKDRLQKYENEAGDPNISKDEYLESPENTDRKKIPHRNIPATFEIHRPLRKPVYYRRPHLYNPNHNRLNQKLRHPLNYNYIKIKPMHYRPLQSYLQRLRQLHAIKYDDENNEYPQVSPVQNFAEPSDGYDIYEKGKENYLRLRNNVDESINKATQENKPTIYEQLELQNNDKSELYTNNDDGYNDEEKEFVPVKSYAQVRKTESNKHLPRIAALEDAISFDEIKNAPRLREAVKSTKAQTVYSEEGYEDSAYDHAGEQKHASDHEGHGGYLKENELSGGKYKIPSVSGNYEDAGGYLHGAKLLHGEKWKNNDEITDEESEDEDYSDDENDEDSSDDSDNERSERNKRDDYEKSMDANTHKDTPDHKESESDQKENFHIQRENETTNQHDLKKRQANFKVPELNLNNTFLTETEILELQKQKVIAKNNDIKEKYPYYFDSFSKINKDSPLRYAENLKFIPKKSKGGTEFYDSRSIVECPEIDDDVDPIPENIKNNATNMNSDDEIEDIDSHTRKKRQANFDELKEKPRLKGLGDKIDCFKAKYFGENPLDSPFFKEDIISNPEPITLPNHSLLKLRTISEIFPQESNNYNVLSILDKGHADHKISTSDNLDKNIFNESLALRLFPINSTDNNTTLHHQIVYSDIIDNIRSKFQKPYFKDNVTSNLLGTIPKNTSYETPNVTNIFFQNKEEVTKLPVILRKKRSTTFVYEPYKVIRDSHVQESKKTSTTSNTSPLIKQLQSSKIDHKFIGQDKVQPVKRDLMTRSYKDIGKNDRAKKFKRFRNNATESLVDFVDVNFDSRRGEPRYEMKAPNHKIQYSPVENKKSMTIEDYKEYTKLKENKNNTLFPKSKNTNSQARQQMKSGESSSQNFFDVLKSEPEPLDVQSSAATKTIRRFIRTTTPSTERESKPNSSHAQEQDSGEEYDEDDDEDSEDYDNDEEEEDSEEVLTTTTTTVKPLFKRKTKVTTTTTTPATNFEEHDHEYHTPKLKLITRFRSPQSKISRGKKQNTDEDELITQIEPKTVIPKYREKSKKTSKSTLLTDTKNYGDGNDDMRKEEIDAMIGVTHDIDEYLPQYEKEMEQKTKENQPKDKQTEASTEDIDEDDGKETVSNEEEYADENDDEDNDDNHDEEEDIEDENEEDEKLLALPEPEPPRRTMVRTTEAPDSTKEAHSAKLELRPIVSKKKIEIHKELPVNKSLPHVTEFKQDIKEVEIVKEYPQEKPLENLDTLELYKNENLAKEVNRLGDVEIFRQNLDLRKGPRHGGNYRREKIVRDNPERTIVKASRGGHLKAINTAEQSSQSRDVQQIDDINNTDIETKNIAERNSKSKPTNRNNVRQNAKLVELRDSEDEENSQVMNRGNPNVVGKHIRGRNKNAKIIEFEEEGKKDSEEISKDEDSESHSRTRNTGRRLHGGNYRSAKILQADDPGKQTSAKISQDDTLIAKSARSKDGPNKAAVLLNSFVQAVPILTTTPSYILDPSKRMYYYVDA